MQLLRSLEFSALALACAIASLAQTSKNFSKDGLTFNYPSGWILQDESKADAQQLTLARSDNDAQIKLFVYRGRIETPEKSADAKRDLVSKYVDATVKTFERMGARPERSAANSEIGGVPAEGVNIRAVLEGEPGAAQVFWAVVGQRLVVMTFFGPDRALKQMTPAWDSVRASVQVEGPKPPPMPSPSSTPK
jgi:hypothetical protein